MVKLIKKLKYILFPILLFITCLAEASKLSFWERWQLEKDVDIPLSSEYQDYYSDKQVLFITGIMGEFSQYVSGYFSAGVGVTQEELEIPTSVYCPSTFSSVEENGHVIAQKIEKLYEDNHKPVIVIAHSKGATEALETVLYHSDLFWEGKIDRLVLIQGVIQGTSLAQPKMLRFPLSLICDWGGGKGVSSLEKEYSKIRLQNGFNEFDKNLDIYFGQSGEYEIQRRREMISKRIFYIRSYVDDDKTSRATRMMRALSRCDIDSEGKNDGLVLSEDQMCQQIGIDLGLFHADHIEPVVSCFLSRGCEKDRRAFIRALLLHLYYE